MQTKEKLVIALYSDDSAVRASVISALGKQIDPTLTNHEIKEFATADALRLYVDSKKQVDLFVLDGEAVPEGGMGVARQLKDEVFKWVQLAVACIWQQLILYNWQGRWQKRRGQYSKKLLLLMGTQLGQQKGVLHNHYAIE